MPRAPGGRSSLGLELAELIAQLRRLVLLGRHRRLQLLEQTLDAKLPVDRSAAAVRALPAVTRAAVLGPLDHGRGAR